MNDIFLNPVWFGNCSLVVRTGGGVVRAYFVIAGRHSHGSQSGGGLGAFPRQVINGIPFTGCGKTPPNCSILWSAPLATYHVWFVARLFPHPIKMPFANK